MLGRVRRRLGLLVLGRVRRRLGLLVLGVVLGRARLRMGLRQMALIASFTTRGGGRLVPVQGVGRQRGGGRSTGGSSNVAPPAPPPFPLPPHVQRPVAAVRHIPPARARPRSDASPRRPLPWRSKRILAACVTPTHRRPRTFASRFVSVRLAPFPGLSVPRLRPLRPDRPPPRLVFRPRPVVLSPPAVSPTTLPTSPLVMVAPPAPFAPPALVATVVNPVVVGVRAQMVKVELVKNEPLHEVCDQGEIRNRVMGGNVVRGC